MCHLGSCVKAVEHSQSSHVPVSCPASTAAAAAITSVPGAACSVPRPGRSSCKPPPLESVGSSSAGRKRDAGFEPWCKAKVEGSNEWHKENCYEETITMRRKIIEILLLISLGYCGTYKRYAI